MPKSAFLPPLDNVIFFDMETEGLDPFKHKIVTIQCRCGGKTTIWKEWEMGEIKCIDSLFELLERVERRVTSFVGYNVLKFDVAFLDQRLRELRLMDHHKWDIIHTWLHWIDLYQFLGNAYYKARDWYSSLPSKQQEQPDNIEIPKLYHQGNYELILSYIEDEMKCMESVYLGLKDEPFYKELVRARQKVMEPRRF